MEILGGRCWTYDKQKVADFVISSYYLKFLNLPILAKKEGGGNTKGSAINNTMALEVGYKLGFIKKNCQAALVDVIEQAL